MLAMKTILSVMLVTFVCSLLLYNTQQQQSIMWTPFTTQDSKKSLHDESFRRSERTRSVEDYKSSEMSKSSVPSCSPHQHIMFLKTHKCASSSVQNMFLRYGVEHNLTFALPMTSNYLGNPSLFQANMIPRSLLPMSGVVDIFSVHTRLNPSEHRKILHPDTAFITVVRDPAYLFESIYNYFHLAHHYKVSFEQFLNWPFEKQQSMGRCFGRFGVNQILFDMGVNVHPNITANEVRQAIDSADELFDTVLIAERMDESLILLKESLCWSYNDVVFFSKNARRDEMKRSLTVSSIEKLRNLNSADVLLYEHFLSKHKEKVVRYGEKKMAEEVAFLIDFRKKIFESCGTKVVKHHEPNSMYKEYSNQVNGYVLDDNSNLQCVLLSLPELTLVKKIRKEQSAKILQEYRRMRIENNSGVDSIASEIDREENIRSEYTKELYNEYLEKGKLNSENIDDE